MVDFNLQNLRTRTFKGFVQFQSPDGENDNYYRMKERQSARVDFRFDYQTHYSDSGQKALDPQGYSHSFTIDLKTTSDLFDDTWLTPSQIDGGTKPADDDMAWQTLSYWIARGNANDPLQIVFVTTLQALGGPAGSGNTTEKYIHMKFTLQPSVFGPITYGTGGSNNITISGDVVSIDYIKRTASATPT